MSEVEVLDPDEPEEEETHTSLPVPQNSKSLVPLDPLAAYLSEIRKYEELDEDEEFEIAVQYQKTQDPALAYKLVTSNLSLVVKIAMTFRREWQNMMDLVQEGNVGLLKALKNFDPFRGVRLPAYASYWIKAYILKFLLDNWRLVKVGTTNTRRKLLYNLQKEKDKLEQQGFTPTTKRLAEHFGVDEQEIIDVEAGLGVADVSLDTPVNEDSGHTPMRMLAGADRPEATVEEEQFREILRDHIARFMQDVKPIEHDLITNRLFSDNPQALQEIGDQYKISREAVRQAEQRLIKKLKKFLEEEMPEAADYFKR